jgi:AraC-like DNA-binding protein
VTPSSAHPRLRGLVAAIDVVENDGGDILVLPSTSTVLGFQFRGSVRVGDTLLAQAGVTGIQPVARRYSYAGGTGSVLVRFTPVGAACLGVPAAELAGRSVPLDAVLPSARVTEVTELLGEARDTPTRITVIEHFLAELARAGDSLVQRAVALLAAPTPVPTIAAVARAVGVSERQLERRFLASVGVTPKRFAALRRFERAVALSPSASSLTAAAIDAGYYDQSHFIRDFRRFAGATPREILAPPGPR